MGGGNLMIVQGGGPTAVFNASLASAIAEANCQQGMKRVYGARFGVRGLVNGDTIELGRMTAGELELLGKSPGAALGSSRYSPAKEDFDRMVSHLRRLDARQIIFMGGNGTMHGAGLVAEHCRTAGFEVQIIGVPKYGSSRLRFICPHKHMIVRRLRSRTHASPLASRQLKPPTGGWPTSAQWSA